MFIYLKKRLELYLFFLNSILKGWYFRNVFVYEISINCELYSFVFDSLCLFLFRSVGNVFIIKLIYEFYFVVCDIKNIIDYVIFFIYIIFNE